MLSFDLTDEQQLLKDSVERFIERSYPFDKRRKASKSEEGYSREHWKQFADLGWLAVGLPEDQGGFGGARAPEVVDELPPQLRTAGLRMAFADEGATRGLLLSMNLRDRLAWLLDTADLSDDDAAGRRDEVLRAVNALEAA